MILHTLHLEKHSTILHCILEEYKDELKKSEGLQKREMKKNCGAVGVKHSEEGHEFKAKEFIL